MAKPKVPLGRRIQKVGPEIKERLRNALAGATAGGTLGVLLKDLKGARIGAAVGAAAGLTQKKRVSVQDTGGFNFGVRQAHALASAATPSIQGKRIVRRKVLPPVVDPERPDLKVLKEGVMAMFRPQKVPLRTLLAEAGARGRTFGRGAARPYQMSAYVEDMTFSRLPKEVQADVLRFVEATAKTPMVHYGMTVKELIGKADAENLKTARKALGTLRGSRAKTEVLTKIQTGTKYILLMNDRIVDGHHFLAKAERGGVTSSLNVLDLTPARVSLVKFQGKPAGRSAHAPLPIHALASAATDKPKLHDRLQVAKDVGSLGLIGGAGVGGHKLYREGRKQVRRLAPAAKRLMARGHLTLKKVDDLVKNWKGVAVTTGDTLKTVKDAVAPVAGVNRGVGAGLRKVGKVAGMFVHEVGPGVRIQAFERDRLSKVRDAALLTGGIATTAAAGLLAAKSRGLVKAGKSLTKQSGVIAGNLRNSTRISNDVGKAYGELKDLVQRPKRLMVKARRGYREGMKEAASKPAPKWARALVRVTKGLPMTKVKPRAGSKPLQVSRMNLAEVGPLMIRHALASAPTPEHQFNLIGTIAGTLIGANVGNRWRKPVFQKLLKGLPGATKSPLRRGIAKNAALAVEQGVPVLGGAIGGALTGGLKKKPKLEDVDMGARIFGCGAARSYHAFGGRDQQADLRTGGFVDPLDVFIGRKKGYAKSDVKDWHRLRRFVDDVKGGRRKGTAGSVARANQSMRDIEGNPTTAAHGQVLKSVLRKADTAQRWSSRVGNLATDAVKQVRGDKREKDRWGREKKREWEKPWFQRGKNQVLAAGAIYGGALVLKKNPRVRAAYDGAKQKVQQEVNRHVQNFFPGAGSSSAPKHTPPATIIQQNSQQAKKIARQAKAARKQVGGQGNLTLAMVGHRLPRLRWFGQNHDPLAPQAQRKKGFRQGVGASAGVVAGGLLVGTRGGRGLLRRALNSVDRPALAPVKIPLKKERVALMKAGAPGKRPERGIWDAVKGVMRRTKRNVVARIDQVGVKDGHALASAATFVAFGDPFESGWDLRDARGRSARVFAPGSRGRDRRPKKWHEKLANERLLWAGGALASAAAGAAIGKKLGTPVKRVRSKAATKPTYSTKPQPTRAQIVRPDFKASVSAA